MSILTNALGTGLQNLLTGNVHTGSWGLPDLGITESIQQQTPLALLGTSSQGGSNINPFNNQVTTQPVANTGSVPGTNPVVTTNPNNPVVKTTSNPTPQTTTTGQTPDFNSMVPSDEQINQQYQSNIDYLNSELAAAQARQPQDLASLQSDYDLAVQKLTATKDAQLRETQTQSDIIQKNRESAYSQARQLYNELIQQAQNKFGGASSAAQGVASIIGRGTQRAFSSANDTAQYALANIFNAQNTINETYALGQKEIEGNYQKGKEDIVRRYDDIIRQISYDRSQTEVAKSQAKIDALTEARKMMFNWENAKQEFQTQLALYAAQNQKQLNDSVASIFGATPTQDTINQASQQIGNSLSMIPTIGQTPAVSSAVNPLLNVQGYYAPAKKTEDYFNNLNNLNTATA